MVHEDELRMLIALTRDKVFRYETVTLLFHSIGRGHVEFSVTRAESATSLVRRSSLDYL